MPALQPLHHDLLYRRCAPEQFPFETTAELEQADVGVGQQRALEAIEFGIGMGGAEYNIYVLGEPGAGKLHFVRELLARHAAGQATGLDWCYVNNFEQPHRPTALRLPPGRGAELQRDAAQLVEELETTIPGVFESEDYRTRVEALTQELTERRENALEELRKDADRQNIVLVRTPGGFAFAPKSGGNSVLSPEEFSRLTEEQRAEIQKRVEILQQTLQKLLRLFPGWQKETREKIKALDREVAEFAVGHLLEALSRKYVDLPAVARYLEGVRRNVIENVDDFRQQPEAQASFLGLLSDATRHERYQVNLIVDNSGQKQAPVVQELLPNHGNLLGRCEYRSFMGSLITDFTMIRAGALHRANGGYLVLEARKLLLQPYAWETLKRVLESGEIRIEALERTFGLMSTAALEPEPVPLSTKVVLVGDRLTYYLLKAYDPDFSKLFKVAADFEDAVPRDDDAQLSFARMLAGLARQHGLRPLDRTAVARVIEHCARLVEDSEKLATNIGRVSDLLREADFQAGRSNRASVTGADVRQALDGQIFRADRLRQRGLENIRRGVVMIDTAGAVCGQVNGLSVVALGDFSFGQPARITATTRLGEGEFIDIERETELGGAIHSKGVMILSSFLSARYAEGVPLSVRASVVFEQSYGEVEGDSASLAELCAILSSIADVPVRQCFAVTGSVNQLGQVQPIGGVNAKIEGFFDVCRNNSLDGSHAVLIPEANVKHLMLREDVVQAARDGKFRIYAVRTVDEALELLTGMPAGERRDDGLFPEDTLNGRVDARLRDYAERRRVFGRGGNSGGDAGRDEHS